MTSSVQSKLFLLGENVLVSQLKDKLPSSKIKKDPLLFTQLSELNASEGKLLLVEKSEDFTTWEENLEDLFNLRYQLSRSRDLRFALVVNFTNLEPLSDLLEELNAIVGDLNPQILNSLSLIVNNFPADGNKEEIISHLDGLNDLFPSEALDHFVENKSSVILTNLSESISDLFSSTPCWKMDLSLPSKLEKLFINRKLEKEKIKISQAQNTQEEYKHLRKAFKLASLKKDRLNFLNAFDINNALIQAEKIDWIDDLVQAVYMVVKHDGNSEIAMNFCCQANTVGRIAHLNMAKMLESLKRSSEAPDFVKLYENLKSFSALFDGSNNVGQVITFGFEQIKALRTEVMAKLEKKLKETGAKVKDSRPEELKEISVELNDYFNRSEALLACSDLEKKEAVFQEEKKTLQDLEQRFEQVVALGMKAFEVHAELLEIPEPTLNGKIKKVLELFEQKLVETNEANIKRISGCYKYGAMPLEKVFIILEAFRPAFERSKMEKLWKLLRDTLEELNDLEQRRELETKTAEEEEAKKVVQEEKEKKKALEEALNEVEKLKREMKKMKRREAARQEEILVKDETIKTLKSKKPGFFSTVCGSLGM